MRYALRNTAFTTALATGLALVGVAATSGSAQAEPAAPAGLYPPSALVLTIGKGEDAATATIDRAVTLSCAPTPTGTHPAPEAACAELDALDGDFAQLSRMDNSIPCLHVWDPVTVTGEGVWRGKRVTWSATYGNTCEMNVGMSRSTVFAF
ncbi:MULTISPECIES: SSI family serine proteinase inhibitor [unclassified Streptomyces]|uniref:SSI family serine proteinase inhibitor n=1 Tax=unclassified Streptomyces TaxID=2593676 RepID=UPI0033F7A0D1